MPGGRLTRLGIDWPISSYSGWGVFGLHLCLALLRRKSAQPVLFHPPQLDLTPAQQALFSKVYVQKIPASRRVDFPVLHALGNQLADFGLVSGIGDAGLVFFEEPVLQEIAKERAKNHRIIVAGSQWNADLLCANGITNVVVAQQGYDETVFHPGPRNPAWPGRFAIFSGGKLEARKAQDIVLQAFAEFRERHGEALLVTAWRGFSEETDIDLPRTPEGKTDLAAWATCYGIPPDAVVDVGFIPNRLMGEVLRGCDAALFPNRCEGGTNLVAMEALASGLPTILSANTGHLDLTGSVPCWMLKRQGASMKPGWGESDVGECVAKLEEIYADPKGARARGLEAARVMQENWSWSLRAGKVAEALGY
ncbi:MAG: glycosyltransferase family 4 protein [Alphaproteobacteria bacterium]|nr:glycosyltransferase family 4 protein [Alphaproteobacteria bacterium]